jgi:hypothetical protein
MASAGLGVSSMVPYMMNCCNLLKRAIEAQGFRAVVFSASPPQHLQNRPILHESIVGARLRHQSLGRGSYKDWLHELEPNDQVCSAL